MALLATGCTDDRKRVQAEVYLCNPSSHTADFDCGDGYVCYAATQAVDSAMCVPACDPEHPDRKCPTGACTQGGECLDRCTVGKVNTCPGGVNGTLTCVRITNSPLESTMGPNGLCLPVAFSCETTDDCGSPVFNLCTSETNGQQENPALLKSGSVCAQGNCARDGVACEPGSTCIQKVLPPSISGAPDVCTPNCLTRTLKDGKAVDECVVGFTCMTQAFPQTALRVCAPGAPGWLCNDSLGCVAGSCEAWKDVGGPFDQFKTCSPTCGDDSDCLIFDRLGNPNALSHFTCSGGHCRSLQSLFFPELCLDAKKKCRLDPDARCVVAPPDTPVPEVAACNSFAISEMPLGAFGGNSAICARGCQSDADCATLTQNSHVTHSCAGQFCLPSVPYLTPCTDDASCMPGLSCLTPPPGGPPYKVCTRSCTSSADCAAHPAMGNVYGCFANQCIPKIESGCSTPPLAQNAELCLSGQLVNGVCLSPKGWPCDNESYPNFPQRCLSGVCEKGHCQ